MTAPLAAGRHGPASPSIGDISAPLGLWCPWCRSPFVGPVESDTGRFVHETCPPAAIDVARLEELARDSWFWQRYRERILGA